MLPKLLTWLIHRIGIRQLLTLALLIFAVGNVAATLSEVVRGISLAMLLTIAVSSILLAWLLAAAKPVPDWLAALVIAILGIEAVGLYLGGLDDDLFAVVQNLVALAVQFGQNPLNGLPDTAAAVQSISVFWTGAVTVAIRTATWFLALFSNQSVFDPVIVTMVWSLAVWGVSAWAAWFIGRRNKPLLAMLPPGALLVVTLANTVGPMLNLLAVLGATLLLIGLTEQFVREHRWQVNNIDYALDIRTDISFAVIIISVSLMALAWAAPSLSVIEVARFSRRLLRGNLAQAESVASSVGLSRRNQAQMPLAEFRASSLPRGHLLGSGPELSQQIALIISVDSAVAKPAEISATQSIPRYYWRSLTYDIYTGRGWRTSTTQQTDYDAGQTVFSPTNAPGRAVLRQHIETITPQNGLLYAAGDLITADHEYSIVWRSSIDPFAITVDAASYTVDALVPAVDQEHLAAAGVDYPDQIEQRFLQLPQQTPDRVLALAHKLTATAPTSFDRAKAIESHLRTFPYSLNLPKPTGQRDMVDYFLFDLQQGYCDYYATSMVVLARAAGLPARMAVGYASGAYDSANNRYLVTEADAHSWPEVYFPEYGWIPFEPTAAQPVNTFSEAPEIPDTAEALPALTPAENTSFIWTTWWLIPSTLILMVVAGVTVWFIVDSWRLQRLPPGGAIAALYWRLQRQAHRRLSLPEWAGQTPYEFATALSVYIERLASESRWQTLLAPTPREVRSLTELYVQTSYSKRSPSDTDHRDAIKIWKRLRWRLWLASASSQITQIKKRS